VEIFETEGKQKTETFLQECFTYLLIALIPIAFGYFIVCKDLVVLLASEKYGPAAAFSPIILIASFCLLCNNILNAGLYLGKNSIKMMFIMLIGVFTDVVLNFILLPKYSLMGASVATLISCITTTVLTIWMSFKYLTVRVYFFRLAYTFALSLIMFLILSMFNQYHSVFSLFMKIFGGSIMIFLGLFAAKTGVISRIKSTCLVKNACV
jgi:O-antigen/teichoic acid export membrane protein